LADPVRIVRRYTPEDRPAIDALRARHGYNYWFADPDDEINPLTLVLEEDGKIVAAITARRTIEAFLVIDKTHGSPADRWDIVKQLVDRGSAEAADLGVKEVHIGIPSWQRGWARRLLSLGSLFYDGRFHLLMAAGSRIGG